MKHFALTWEQIMRLPIDSRCKALAILLAPYCVPQTHTLRDTPSNLLRRLFGNQLNTARPIAMLKAAGVLENDNPAGGTRGTWTLHPPQGMQGNAADFAYTVAIESVAREFVGKFGVDAVLDLIAALKAVAKE